MIRSSYSQDPLIRLLYENSTTYLSVDDITSLSSNGNFSLSLVAPSSSPSVKISFQPLFKEFIVTNFINEVLIDSFGFRLGGVSSNVLQLIITNKFMYLYTLSPSPANLTLKFLSKWECNKLVNTDPKKYFSANSTTIAIQQTPYVAEFILIAVQDGTVNEKMAAFRLSCSLKDEDPTCTLTTSFQAGVFPMYFYSVYNSSNSSRCESNLKYLSNAFADQFKDTKKEQTANLEHKKIKAEFSSIYFVRFCKISQLPFSQQLGYTNKLEIYKKDENDKVTQIKVIERIQNPENQTVDMQAVQLQEFGNQIVLFNIGSTYILNASSLFQKTPQVTAIQEFQNPAYIGFVECQQNENNVLSCYLDMYLLVKSSMALPPELILNPLNRTSPLNFNTVNDITYNSSFFAELIKNQDRVLMIPPISFSSTSGNQEITAINLNFLVFRQTFTDKDHSNESEAKKRNHTILSIIQRGTLVQIGDFRVSDELFAMKGFGTNFMMYRDTDIGLSFKLAYTSDGKTNLTASIYTIHLPHFRISAGAANQSLTCFAYSQGCQLVEFNFSFVRNLKNEMGGHERGSDVESQIVKYFHLNLNFSSVVPLFDSMVKEVEISKDTISLNISELFFGMPDSFATRISEYSPIGGISNLTLGQDEQDFRDFRVNVSKFKDMDTLPGYILKEIKPFITRYRDGSFYLTLIMNIVSENNPENFYWTFAQLPDKLDTNLDFDFVFTLNNLVLESIYFMAEPLKKIVFVNNENYKGTHLFLIYGPSLPLSICTPLIRQKDASIECDNSQMPKNLPEMTVKTANSSPDKSNDDCLIITSPSQFEVYLLTFPTEGPILDKIKASPLLKISFDSTDFEWPIGRPIEITDVSLLDFNVLYISVTVQLKNGTIQNIVQIHQCDFYQGVDCYFYTWVFRGNRKVFIDDSKFNFCLFDPETQVVDIFRMTDFQREFINIVKKEMISVRSLKLRDVLNDKDIYQWDQNLDVDIHEISHQQVFSVGVFLHGKMGVLVLYTNIQIRPTRFLEVPTQILGYYYQLHPTNSNTFPFGFPMVYRYNAEDEGVLEIILLNPFSGHVITNPQKSNISEVENLFQTDIFELLILKERGTDLIQLFQGKAYFDFRIFQSNLTRIPEGRTTVQIGPVFQGFIQNLTIFCPNEEGHQSLTRNHTVQLTCIASFDEEHRPVKPVPVEFLYTPYITKDFDFVGNNYLGTVDESETPNPKPGVFSVGNVTDSLNLNLSSQFVFLLHSNVSIVETGDFSRVVATYSLFEDPLAQDISLESCLSIYEGIYHSNDSIDIYLVCKFENISLVVFSVNLTEVTQEAATKLQEDLPIYRRLPAVIFLFKSPVIDSSPTSPDYFNRFLIGSLFFQLDSILLETYNNKPYLSAYQLIFDEVPGSTQEPRFVTPKLFWSSLSEDRLNGFNLSRFRVTKLDSSSETHLNSVIRTYRISLIMTKEDEIGCSVGVIVVQKDSATLQMNDECEFPNPTEEISVDSVMLYQTNETLFTFILSGDVIYEWHTSDYVQFTQGLSFEFSQVCDVTDSKLFTRNSDFFLVYCFNASLNGVNDDIMLIYNTAPNTYPPYFPVQQVSFPDPDSPSSRFLAFYNHSTGGAKLLLSSTRTFITQYSLMPFSSVVKKTPGKETGTAAVRICLSAQNLLSTSQKTVTFQNDMVHFIKYYVSWTIHQSSLIAVVGVYLVFFLGMTGFMYLRNRSFENKTKSDEEFVHYYGKLMARSNLKDNLLPYRRIEGDGLIHSDKLKDKFKNDTQRNTKELSV